MYRPGAQPGFRTNGVAIPGCLLLAGLALYSVLFADSYDLRLLAVAGCYALLTLGYQFIFGHAGALSLAQGAFFGLGAYGSALLALHLDLPVWLTLPAGVAATVLIALLVCLPVIRLESHYLALATLGISQVVLLVVIDWVALTGGSNGLPGVPPIEAGGFTTGVAGDFAYALFVWLWVGLGAGLTLWLLRRRLGRALPLLREDPVLAASVGINVARTRLAAFLLSALARVPAVILAWRLLPGLALHSRDGRARFKAALAAVPPPIIVQRGLGRFLRRPEG